MLGKVLKAKYYPRSSLLEASRGSHSSYVWRRIHKTFNLIHQGLYWSVGDGNTIRIWRDKWLLKPEPSSDIIRWPGCSLDTKVLDLFKDGTSIWCPLKLSHIISDEDVDHVKYIRPSVFGAPDKPTWYYTNHGEYVVKSGYHLLQSGPPSGTDMNHGAIFKCLWSLQVPNKLKHFWWRVVRNSLAVASNLRRRGIPVDYLCQTCGEEPKDANHVLFKCRVAKEIWSLSPQCFELSDSGFSDNLMDNVEKVVNQQPTGSSMVCTLGPFLGWRIWKMRNDLIFNNIRRSILETITHACLDLQTWCKAMEEQNLQFTYETGRNRTIENDANLIVSLPFGSDLCLVFTDGSWHNAMERAGVGWLLYKADRRIVQGRASIPPTKSPLEVELLAVYEALFHLRRFNFPKVHLLSDNKQVVSLLKHILMNSSSFSLGSKGFNSHLYDIAQLIKSFCYVNISYTSRNCNAIADDLAKKARLNTSPLESVITWY